MKFLFFISCILCGIITEAQTFTKEHGRLTLKGHQMVDEHQKPIQLRGLSTFNLTFQSECVTFNALKSNRDFWGVNMVRAAMYTDDWWNDRNYNKNPQFNKEMIDGVVRWAEKLGIYCIIDWHILTKGNPNSSIHAEAGNFFDYVSKKYKDKTHIIYEICNEPSGKGVTWDTVAEYANKIIPIIRKNDNKSLIVVGTPNWCQQIDQVNPKQLVDTFNVMYSFHFYAATHAGLLPMFETQIHRIPVFVTEWGVCEASGNGNINFDISEKYINTMAQHVSNGDTVQISWCNFSFGDKKEAASVLKPNSCKLQQWENMTPTGLFVRDCLKSGK